MSSGNFFIMIGFDPATHSKFCLISNDLFFSSTCTPHYKHRQIIPHRLWQLCPRRRCACETCTRGRRRPRSQRRNWSKNWWSWWWWRLWIVKIKWDGEKTNTSECKCKNSVSHQPSHSQYQRNWQAGKLKSVSGLFSDRMLVDRAVDRFYRLVR